MEKQTWIEEEIKQLNISNESAFLEKTNDGFEMKNEFGHLNYVWNELLYEKLKKHFPKSYCYTYKIYFENGAFNYYLKCKIKRYHITMTYSPQVKNVSLTYKLKDYDPLRTVSNESKFQEVHEKAKLFKQAVLELPENRLRNLFQ